MVSSLQSGRLVTYARNSGLAHLPHADTTMTIRLDCREARRLLSRAQDEPLSMTAGAKLRLHLFVCATCRKTGEQLRFLRNAMAAMKVVQRDDDRAPPEQRH